VVPCYQEEQAVAAFAGVLSSLDAEEIVFVDDGSTDATPERLRDLSAADARVRVATHAKNRGVGAAMRTGFAAARGEIVVAYDADRTYPVEDVARLVHAVERGAGVATASPFAKGGAVDHVPWGRRFLSRGAAFAYRLVLGRRARGLTTFTCAFRAYRRSVLRDLSFRSDGFAAAGEILGRVLLKGERVVEVASRLTARTEGASKMRVVKALREHLLALALLVRARLGGRGAGSG
jgi:dolichol-phosphate mannosyltransferase